MSFSITSLSLTPTPAGSPAPRPPQRAAPSPQHPSGPSEQTVPLLEAAPRLGSRLAPRLVSLSPRPIPRGLSPPRSLAASVLGAAERKTTAGLEAGKRRRCPSIAPRAGLAAPSRRNPRLDGPCPRKEGIHLPPAMTRG